MSETDKITRYRRNPDLPVKTTRDLYPLLDGLKSVGDQVTNNTTNITNINNIVNNIVGNLTPQFTNGNASPIVIGTPVYVSANDTVDKAKADAVGTVNVVGFVAEPSIASSASGGILMDGVLSATTGQWDAVAGTTGGLTKDVIYYLSTATAGQITSTPPTTGYTKELGIGVSTTELKIDIKNRIKM